MEHVFRVQDAAWRLPLDSKGKMVLMNILWRYNYTKEQAAFPSQKKIAQDTGLSSRAVQYALSDLVKEGFLTVVVNKNNGKANEYTPVFEAILTGVRKNDTEEDTSDKGVRTSDVGVGTNCVGVRNESVPGTHELRNNYEENYEENNEDNNEDGYTNIIESSTVLTYKDGVPILESIREELSLNYLSEKQLTDLLTFTEASVKDSFKWQIANEETPFSLENLWLEVLNVANSLLRAKVNGESHDPNSSLDSRKKTLGAVHNIWLDDWAADYEEAVKPTKHKRLEDAKMDAVIAMFGNKVRA